MDPQTIYCGHTREKLEKSRRRYMRDGNVGKGTYYYLCLLCWGQRIPHFDVSHRLQLAFNMIKWCVNACNVLNLLVVYWPKRVLQDHCVYLWATPSVL